MSHVYLSPHLDDAVLSCGGAIYHQATAGEGVLVITVFAGEFQGSDLSPFALEQHRLWGNVSRPMALRRAEDIAALTLLGAEVCHLDSLDAVYRATSDLGDGTGVDRWLYPDLETLLGAIHPADPVGQQGAQELADHLAALIPCDDGALIYAPLGVGCHVDHQLVHAAARKLLQAGFRVVFYEDYPYAERSGATTSALSAADAESWRLQTISLDPADLSAKVSALGYYRSQLAVLFGGAEAMPSRVWTFAATRSPDTALAEPIWWPR
jgi:LmbE family N-acetylglucosaminyl deacetylase